ncbi:MAG: 30S ribosomal protein S2 [Candidatus Jorgensenbacteria bacterium]
MEIDSTISNETALEMVNLGVLFGHKKSKTHPRMRPFIAGMKNEIELIDPEATLVTLEAAAKAVESVVERGESILLVGTLAPSREAVELFARTFQFPYVINRWLGGTLTNFKVISDRMKHYQDLKAKRAAGEFAKYTKKEQAKLGKDIGKLAKNFEGLTGLTKLPALLIMVDPKAHATAVAEAHHTGIPVVAVLDTDDDPQGITYPIYASDRAKSSVEWVMKTLTERAAAKRARLAEALAERAARPQAGEAVV